MIWDESKHPRDKAGGFTDGTSLTQEFMPDEEINDLKDKSIEELKELAKSNNPDNRKSKLVLIGKVNFADENSVLNTLGTYEKILVDLPYELSITITTDGSIWQVDGTSASVDTTVIPHSLEGSYSYHNHPKDATWYSFGADDVDFFLTQEEQRARASDDKYFYSMTRTPETITYKVDVNKDFKEHYMNALQRAFDGEIDMDIDGYHEAITMLAEKYHFKYERRKK